MCLLENFYMQTTILFKGKVELDEVNQSEGDEQSKQLIV